MRLFENTENIWWVVANGTAAGYDATTGERQWEFADANNLDEPDIFLETLFIAKQTATYFMEEICYEKPQ